MRSILIFGIVLLSKLAIGQIQKDSIPEKNSIFSLGLRGHGGYFLKHSPILRQLKESYPWGIEADIAWQLTSEKAYSHCSCYPRLGLSVNYFNFDNGPVLGSAYYVIGYLEPVFFLPRRFNLTVRFGMVGFAFMDRPYNAESNPTNHTYSSVFAFPLVIGIGFNYRANDRWNVRLGANYNHISNGGIKKPNLGINYPSAHLGVDYSFQPVNMKSRGKVRRPPPEKKNRLELDIGNSMKGTGLGDSALYWIMNTNLQYSRWLHRSTAIAVGANFEMDNSRGMRIAMSDNPNRSHLRLSFSVGHEFWLGKVQFGNHIGVYAFDEFKVDQIWYHRHELTFQILPYLYASFGVKAHLQVADYMDLKIGYNFNWK